MIRIRMATLAVAGFATLGVAAGTAAPAQAATGWARCPQGYFCAFTEPNGTGVMAQYREGDGDLSDAYGPQGMNDNIESVWNRYPSFYWATKGLDTTQQIAFGSDKYGTLPTGWSNSISALRPNVAPPG